MADKKKKNMLDTFGSDVGGFDPYLDSSGGTAVDDTNAPDASTVAPTDTVNAPTPDTVSPLPPRPSPQLMAQNQMPGPPPGGMPPPPPPMAGGPPPQDGAGMPPPPDMQGGPPGAPPGAPPPPPFTPPSGANPASVPPPPGPPSLEDQTIQQVQKNVMQSDPGMPKPPVWRRILGGIAASPFGMGAQGFAPLITYGPSGLDQIQQHREYLASMPQQVRLADTMETANARRAIAQQSQQERADALDETARKNAETARKDAADEAIKQANEQTKFIKDGGRLMPPGSQAPPGWDPVPSMPYDQGKVRFVPGLTEVTPEMANSEAGKFAGLQVGDKLDRTGLKMYNAGAVKLGLNNRTPQGASQINDRVDTLLDPAEFPKQNAAARRLLMAAYADGTKDRIDEATKEFDKIVAEADDQRRQKSSEAFQAAQRADTRADMDTNRLNERSDKYATPYLKNIDAIGQQLAKIENARANVNAKGAVGKALALPQVLSGLVAGNGSGVRITMPELDRLAKARGLSEGVEAFFNRISGQGDLAKGQVDQINAILDDAKQRLAEKQNIQNEIVDSMRLVRSQADLVKVDRIARNALSAHEQGQLVRHNANTGEWGKSTDGGKTWQTIQ